MLYRQSSLLEAASKRIGPTGEFIEPLGTVTENEMADGFKRQINGLLDGGVDAIIFEIKVRNVRKNKHE